MATPIISGTTRTNLGPLTTATYTYRCTEVIQRCSTCSDGWAAQTCIDGVVTDNTDCWPPRATNVPATSGALLGWGVFSPGIVCPGGYTSVATGEYGGSSDFPFQYPLMSGETAIGCCPEGGFTPITDGHGDQTCVQRRATTPFLLGSCGNAGPTYMPFTVGETLNSTRYTNFAVSAPFMQVVYQASDLPARTTSSPSITITTPSSGSDQPTGQASGSDQPTGQASSPSNKTSGLTTATAAGIGIGVALGVILLAAAAAYCFWRVRQKRTQPTSSNWNSDTRFKPLETSEYAYAGNPIEMSNTTQSRPGAAQSGHFDPPNFPAELAVAPPTPELGSTTTYR